MMSCRPSALLTFTLLASLATASPLAAQAGQTWSFDETTTGQDIAWTSPTAVNPTAALFNTTTVLTAVEVGISFSGIPLGAVDVLGQIPPEQQTTLAEVGGPAPLLLAQQSVVFPLPPEPTSVGAEISIGLNASGFGTFDATNIILGNIDVDLGFPLGVQAVTITSLRVAGNMTIQPTWFDLGNALSGTGATPETVVSGTLAGGSLGSVGVNTDLAFGTAHLVIGLSQVNVNFKNGTLVPAPDVLIFGLPLDGNGDLAVPFTWPSSIPSRASVFLQFWMPDVGGPVGFAASNGVRGETP
ncbi:MAG: hypothetical protein ACI9EF_001156 [Pseudohongiellaceae bacterium]|jgi:hypothetical protein